MAVKRCKDTRGWGAVDQPRNSSSLRNPAASKTTWGTHQSNMSEKTNQETQKFLITMLEIHGSHFSQSRKKKRKPIKNTENITGKIKKYEGVHLYQQTLTVKMQPLPMKE